MAGKLYLIPNTIGSDPDIAIPRDVRDITIQLKYFIVEDLRTTRRYLKQLDKSISIDGIHFKEIDKHNQNDYRSFLKPILNGIDGGLISEAGLPAIADPGSNIVREAHKLDIMVIPLTGPSSIFLALAASGLNGQQFSFQGYLPRPTNDLSSKLRALENQSLNSGAAIAFIEAPYRNMRLVDVLLKTLSNKTLLSISHSLTTEEEWIRTMSIADWKNYKIPDFHKKPAIFIIQVL